MSAVADQEEEEEKLDRARRGCRTTIGPGIDMIYGDTLTGGGGAAHGFLRPPSGDGGVEASRVHITVENQRTSPQTPVGATQKGSFL